MTTKEDLALLQQTMPTGVEGLRALEKFTREGNGEVRKLLYDEADVLLECRYCRNIFRSVINFISHKRAFCRASHVVVTMANQVDDEGRMETATKKRIGQMGGLTRRLEQNLVPIGDTQEMLALYTLPRVMKELPTTTFADGMQKIIGSLPSNLAQKETLPEDRVCLTMPQDNSSRYKEMSLRSRKSQNIDKPQHREFTSAEIKIIENFEKQDVRCGDFVLLQCDHPSCANVRPFHSLQALAYHCSLRHTRAFANEAGDERWPCLLCCRHMWTLEGVHTHLLRVHPNVKEDHLKRRAEEERSKPGKKPVNVVRRTRSLSMDASAAAKTSSHAARAADSTEDDTEGTDEEDDDEQEEMIIEEEEQRGRRRSARGRGGERAAPLQLQKPMERQSRGRSGNSEDYGEPPVLRPADECGLEEEADEEDDDEPLVRKGTSQSLSQTPDSERDSQEKEKGRREVKVEEEEDDDEEDEEEEMEKQDEFKYNTVEGCMADLLNSVCSQLGEKVEKKRKIKKSQSITPPARSESQSKRRGRPPNSLKKSDEERITPKLGRPFGTKKGSSESTGGGGSGEQPRVKRQYIRKKDKEASATATATPTTSEQRDRESASSEHSDPSSSQQQQAAVARPALEEARPARMRKRPRWMMNGEEVYDEGSRREEPAAANHHDQSMADESEEEDAPPKEDIKRKKPTTMALLPSKMITPSKHFLTKHSSSSSHHYSSEERRALETSRIGAEINAEAPDLMLFTPRSGKSVQDRIRANETGSSRKRKQNLGKLADDADDIMIVSMNDPMSGPKRSDLTSVPVYLSEHQQSIFFSGLVMQKDAEDKNYYQCKYCMMKLPNIRDGRRHMVAHLRVMRLRCGLCGAGAFFCIDMRNHLQLRGCPELAKAPPHMIRAGTPCMTKEHADELTYVAHNTSPGRALFTSGKIVSILDNKPYLPDPVIEEKILGPTRVPPPNSSPRKPAHKFVMASALKEAERSAHSSPVKSAPRAVAVAAAAVDLQLMPVLPLATAAAVVHADAPLEDEDATPPATMASAASASSSAADAVASSSNAASARRVLEFGAPPSTSQAQPQPVAAAVARPRILAPTPSRAMIAPAGGQVEVLNDVSMDESFVTLSSLSSDASSASTSSDDDDDRDVDINIDAAD